MKTLSAAFLALTLTATATAHASDRHLARFIFEEAEQALASENFELALTKLHEAEQAFGEVNPPILNGRIQAGYALFEKHPSFERLTQLQNDTTRFLKLYGAEPALEDMAREAYIVQQAVKRYAEAEAAKLKEELQRAEAGDVNALAALVARHQQGMGVAKDATKARQWQERLIAAQAANDLRMANEGYIAAMERLIRRYETGDGLAADAAQASQWRERLTQAQAEQAAKEAQQQAEAAAAQEQQRIQAEIDSINYFAFTGEFIDSIAGEGADMGSVITTMMVSSAIPLAFDLLSTPNKFTQIQLLQNEASMRSAAWGNPDSMMNTAFQMYEAPANGHGVNTGSEAAISSLQ